MSKKMTVVTAALPYANGDIHVGHLIEYLQVDIYARNLTADGEACIFVCADDAHGAPIQIRAEREGIDPVALIDGMRTRHLADFARFSIAFDVYHSTHSEENRILVEEIFHRLEAGGFIFSADVPQLYDEVAARFLADRYIKGDCPRCAAPDQYGDGCEKCGATFDALELRQPVSVLSGAVPVVRSSNQLFFDIPQLTDFLRAFQHEIRLQPSVTSKLDEWFEQGLKAWNISRDEPYFGFRIPGHPGKYFYVWVDAPIGYLASFKYYCDQAGHDFEKMISDPATDLVHFIGKDIAYFHTIFWPAMLRAAGMRRPTSIFCHGFLTVNGAKMSKSRGTLIAAAALADAIDTDLFRYFVFAMLGDDLDDIDLTLSTFKDRVNAELIGKIINIGPRCAAVLHRLTGGAMSERLIDEARFDDYLEELAGVRDLIRARRYSTGCRRIVALAEQTNRWLNDAAPWTLAKGNETQRQEATAICSQGLLEFRALMVALMPVTPSLSARATGLFEGASAPWSESYADIDIRDMMPDLTIAPFPTLLQRITDDQLSHLTISET